jgi:hypothetical protein
MAVFALPRVNAGRTSCDLLPLIWDQPAYQSG